MSHRDEIRWDTSIQEPFILVPVFPDLRVTPTRKGDEADLVRLYNTPEIGERLYSRPYPYPSTEALKLVEQNIEDAREVIAKLESVLSSQSLDMQTNILPGDVDKVYLSYPFTCIRLSNQLIGTISLSPFLHDPRNLTETQMLALPPSEQIWIIGYQLDPAYHNRGIMTAVLRVIMEGWVREWMRIGEVTAGVEVDNDSGNRLVEKLGFVKIIEIEIPWPGGGTRRIGHYVKKISDDQ